MKEIFETCEPRAEVLEGELREELFAARLKDVIDGKADPVYQDPKLFFDNTYATDGLTLLLDEALGRLTGFKPANNAIIRLETAFGGGKTHNLIALYHAACGYRPPKLDLHKELFPTEGAIRIVGVVGSDLDPSSGLEHDGLRTYTLWGELAYQLGGKTAYQTVEQSDRNKAAPGTALWDALVTEQPTLIMLDELGRHMRAAKAVPTATGKSDLAEQIVAFLMSLLEFAASRKQVVVVLSLAGETDAFAKETEELRQALAEARSVSARQERVITSTGETEIAPIVTHRLFRSIDRPAAEDTAEAYISYLKRCIDQDIDLPQRAVRAEYAQEIMADYPFHPELLTTLYRKTSTIPNFQRTRGALRLMARVVRRLWEEQPPHSYLVHPHHVDLGVDAIADELTSRLDRPAFRQVIEADIVSPKKGMPAHAQDIDRAWEQAGRAPYARRAASTAFIHSLTQGVATGVDAADLTLAALQPDDDPAMITKALSRLVESCWFFDWDGRRYRFKTEPSLNKIVADEMQLVGRVRAKTELDDRIRRVWQKGYFEPVPFASEAGDVEDNAGKPKLVIIHYDAAATSAGAGAPPDLLTKIFDHAGSLEGYRTFKNNVVFLVADEDQVENMVDVAQRYLAIGRILGDAERMGEFTEEQRKRLKKIGEAAELDVRVAITKAYRYLYYPSADAPQKHSNLARETLPAQDQGEVDQNQANVVLRVFKQLQKVLTADDTPLAAAYVRAKAWDAGQSSISTEDLRRAFARRMGLRILLDVNQLKKTIRDGVSAGVWIYFNAEEQMGYGKASPIPAIQISEDAILYSVEEAKRLGLQVKGEQGVVEGREQKCPVCGEPVEECTCGEGGGEPSTPIRLHGEGAPSQACQQILDQGKDQGMSAVSRLVMQVEGTGREGAQEARAMGLAIPQLGKAQYRIEQTMNAEFGEEGYLSMRFEGPWDRYKRLKQVTDPFGEEASKVGVRTTLTAVFPDGLSLDSDQFQTIHEVFATLGFGHMIVDALPHKPEQD